MNAKLDGWAATLIQRVEELTQSADTWGNSLSEGTDGVHLAVFVEPYLKYVLQGKKTVESRFSVVRCAPYGRVEPGDIILLKRAGGPVVGLCEVAQVWSYRLDPTTWSEIRSEFTTAICAQAPDFWKERERASFATLIRIRRVTAIEPLACSKRDRRGWVVLRSRTSLEDGGQI